MGKRGRKLRREMHAGGARGLEVTHMVFDEMLGTQVPAKVGLTVEEADMLRDHGYDPHVVESFAYEHDVNGIPVLRDVHVRALGQRGPYA